MGWKIFGLCVSIMLIIAGFSGDYVLRGTESSTALIVVGFAFLAWDIYSIATHGKDKKKKEAAATELSNRNNEFYTKLMDENESEYLTETRNIDLYLLTRLTNSSSYPIFLNGQSFGEISPKNRPVSLQTNRKKNSFLIEGKDGFKTYFFFEVTGEPVPDKFQKPGIQINADDNMNAPQKTFTIFATGNSGLTKINI